MKLGQVTIKDIAKALNISSSTVSRALKDYPGISEETKSRVKALAKEMNYRPNAVALSLRKSKSHTIGVIIPEVVHFFFSTVISGIEEVAYANGYNVILCQTNEKVEREISSVDTIISNQIDGLLVSYSKETTDFSHFQKLIDYDYPVVFFDRAPELGDVVNVTVNDFSGAYQAVQHLISQGYREILHLAGPKNLLISKNRKEGYQAALKDAGLEIREDRIIECPLGTPEESEEICLKLFSDPNERPDAVFSSNDIAALGALKAIKSLGLEVPKDVGVVGFSNWQFASMIDPPLSTVSQPGFQMGEKAAQLLLEMIDQKEAKPTQGKEVVLETELIVRGSSQRK
ncbi:LacI family DNA-binding transcriptional regulator [Echinicola jeungdonensis]|uniref:LacI family DNA-binding transcriptional regulator n=1 Tax=Echinicola jeungdonensis TaxID=709343 RepID=A0ABV5J644_9BACT|nr:LacI family DNA-binding transcriptional regulator [Echinicola jeungdonensis]MDN3667907.1 LacI family DNA-binding transcriptional regulator [Echinicola jeungdonensis]